ncbi:MAG: glycosyltransferase family 2 protein [Thermodesulfovibrionales bacterium]|nr:glycosyltransferase family 2 protein [Thermodesulfovibrionales bacterium]
MKDLTIGIATWNAAGLLRDCLSSIRQNVNGLTYEVVVADNGSVDDTPKIMTEEFPEFHYIRNEVNEGVASARNKCLQRADSKYVIVLDVDTIILPDSFQVLMDVMEQNPRVGIGGPKLLNPDRTVQLSCRTFQTPLTVLFRGTPLGKAFPRSHFVKDHLMTDWDHENMRPVDWMMGACHIIRRETLEDIGLLDEGFFYLYEDVEYCWRAKKKGWDVLYIPQSRIIHIYQRQSAAKFNVMTLRHIQSICRFLRIRYLGYGDSLENKKL